jgi:hypothetical protein
MPTNPPWIKALAEVRHLAPRERGCYHHVQAIIVAIDQYAEAALGKREFFLNKPYGSGGSARDNIP